MFVAPVFLQIFCPYWSGADAESCQMPIASAGFDAGTLELRGLDPGIGGLDPGTLELRGLDPGTLELGGLDPGIGGLTLEPWRLGAWAREPWSLGAWTRELGAWTLEP